MLAKRRALSGHSGGRHSMRERMSLPLLRLKGRCFRTGVSQKPMRQLQRLGARIVFGQKLRHLVRKKTAPSAGSLRKERATARTRSVPET